MSIRRFSKIRNRAALSFAWALAVVFLVASVKSAVGVTLMTAALDGHHVPVLLIEHGHAHIALSHGDGHHHDDHGPNALFPLHSSVGHVPDGDHESHLHEYVEEAVPSKRLMSPPLVTVAEIPAFSKASAPQMAVASVRHRPPPTPLLSLSTVVLLN